MEAITEVTEDDWQEEEEESSIITPALCVALLGAVGIFALYKIRNNDLY